MHLWHVSKARGDEHLHLRRMPIQKHSRAKLAVPADTFHNCRRNGGMASTMRFSGKGRSPAWDPKTNKTNSMKSDFIHSSDNGRRRGGAIPIYTLLRSSESAPSHNDQRARRMMSVPHDASASLIATGQASYFAKENQESNDTHTRHSESPWHSMLPRPDRQQVPPRQVSRLLRPVR